MLKTISNSHKKNLTLGKIRYNHGYQHQTQLLFPTIVHFEAFSNYSNQFNLVDDTINASQSPQIQTPNPCNPNLPNPHDLSSLVRHKYIQSLATCFNDYNSDRDTPQCQQRVLLWVI